MALSPASYYDIGTVSVAAGGTAVTGVGTSWSGVVVSGDTLALAGLMVPIKEVVSSTSLTLLRPWPGAAQAGAGYAVMLNAPDRLAVTAIPTALRGLIEQTRILSGRVETYAVVARQDAPPAAPVTDDMYLLGAAPSGAWAGRADYIAQWSGTGWVYIAPKSGMRAYSRAADVLYQRGVSAWTAVPATFAVVATTGAYADLTGKPTLGTMAARAAADYLPVSSYTAADVLAKVVSLSGPGKGLNADMVDGYHLADLDYRYTGSVRLGAVTGIPVSTATAGYDKFIAASGYVITDIYQAQANKSIGFVNGRPIQMYSNYTSTWVTVAGV